MIGHGYHIPAAWFALLHILVMHMALLHVSVLHIALLLIELLHIELLQIELLHIELLQICAVVEKRPEEPAFFKHCVNRAEGNLKCQIMRFMSDICPRRVAPIASTGWLRMASFTSIRRTLSTPVLLSCRPLPITSLLMFFMKSPSSGTQA